MKKSEIYEKFIDKWQNRLGGVSILNRKAVLNRIALPYNELQQRMQEISSREGLTANQREELLNNVTRQKANMLSNAYEQAQLQDIQQRGQINTQIMSLEEKQTIAKQEEEALKDRQKANWIKAGATVLGGAVGSVIPGVGTMVGASVGSGLGNIIVGSIDKYNDPDAILQGTGDLLSAYSTWHTSSKIKDTASILAQYKDRLGDISESELTLLKYYLENGNLEGIKKLFGGGQ